MATAHFRIAKMDCTAEEQLVRMRLDSVVGIRRVDIDLDNRTVAVEHETDIAEVAAALDSLHLDCTELGEHDAPEPLPPVDSKLEHRALLLALGINAAFFVGEMSSSNIALQPTRRASALACANKARFVCCDNGLNAAAQSEFCEHGPDMALHRLVADEEFVCDVAVRLSPGEE
jgi:copper chaperone CopZ